MIQEPLPFVLVFSPGADAEQPRSAAVPASATSGPLPPMGDVPS